MTFLGALVAFVWITVAHRNPLTTALRLSVFGPKEDAVLAARLQRTRPSRCGCNRRIPWAGSLRFCWASCALPFRVPAIGFTPDTCDARMKSLIVALNVVFAFVPLQAQTNFWNPSLGHTQLVIWPGNAPDSPLIARPETTITVTNSLIRE